MRDRLPAYGMANRVKITQDDGTIVEGVLSYADGATQQGSAYNKANVLPDIVCMTLGLSTESEPRDLFDVLAHAGDLHVWMKTVKNAADVPAGYNLGVKTTKTIVNTKGDSHGRSTIYYSSSVSVSDSGNVSLINPSSIGVEIYTSSLPIVGKFFYIDLSSVQTSDLIKKKIYFVPADTDISVNDSPKAFSGVVQEVTGYAKVPAGTTTTYPVSTNPNAYQEGDDAKEAGYVVGEAVSGQFKMSERYPTDGYYYKYASSISVADNGTISLDNPSQISFDSSNGGQSYANSCLAKIAGKFMYLSNRDSGTNAPDSKPPFNSVPSGVVHIPSDATLTWTEGGALDGFVLSKYQPVTGYAAIPAGTTIEYLGKLGDKARVQVVSYVGTGTFGEKNPNSLTFDFVPKMLFVCGHYTSDWPYFMFATEKASYAHYSSQSYRLTFTLWNKTVKWYYDNADGQLNLSGRNYDAVAIG